MAAWLVLALSGSENDADCTSSAASANLFCSGKIWEDLNLFDDWRLELGLLL